jgi:hypothetical protein
MTVWIPIVGAVAEAGHHCKKVVAKDNWVELVEETSEG